MKATTLQTSRQDKDIFRRMQSSAHQYFLCPGHTAVMSRIPLLILQMTILTLTHHVQIQIKNAEWIMPRSIVKRQTKSGLRKTQLQDVISTLNVSMAKTKLDAKLKENTSAKASSTPRRRSSAPAHTTTRSSTPTTPAGRSSPTERSGAMAHQHVQMGKTKRSAIFLLRLSNTLSVSYSFFSPHHFKHFFQLLLFWFCC